MSSTAPAARPHGSWWLLAVSVALLVGLSLVLSAGPASAHATLIDADPADRSELAQPPSRVQLTFSEPVEVPTGGVRVLDESAERVDLGTSATGDKAVVAVDLPADLPDGGYVVIFRVVSEDSHPASGVRTFTVGDAEAVGDALLQDLATGGDPGLALQVGRGVRGLGYLATLLAAGAAFAAWRLVRRQEELSTAHRLATLAARAGLLIALVAVPVQAVSVTGELSAAWSPVALSETLASPFGLSAVLRAIWLAALAVLLWLRASRAAASAAGALAVASFVLDGHQRSVEPGWLLIGGDLLHLAAAAVWIGGLALLVLELRRPDAREDPVGAAGLVARFSTLALVTIGALAVGGVLMAPPLLGSVGALTATGYGRVFLGKLALVGVIVAVAAYNRGRLVPAIAGGDEPHRETRTDRAWSQLSRTMRIEGVLVVAVLFVTAVLATSQPGSDAAGFGGVFQTEVPLGGEHQVEVVVDPNVAGSNAIHVFAVDDTGRPSARIEDLRLELTYLPEGIGPIEITPFTAGPGHWTTTSDELRFPGDWEVRVIGGLDRFTEVDARIVVPVGG